VRTGAITVLAIAATALSACGGTDHDDGRLVAATTVAPITNIVASVGGDRIEVHGIVPEGTNSHTFEPRPSVAELLAVADVVFTNGLELEEPTKDLAEQIVADDVEIVELGDRTLPEREQIYDFSFPRSGGKPNPHLWTDPLHAIRYAREVEATLHELDPDGAAEYTANADAFEARMRSLDEGMRVAFATIPAAQRKLLTYHDAYAYFAKDYDFDVIGAIQVSDFEDPTASELADLIEQVEAERVPAVFGSEVFPSPVLRQLAREGGARYVDDLRDDDLPGRPGDPEHSLLGLLQFNFATITAALGGDPAAIDAVELVANADTAEYPQ
jgi:ABC-type Zn uptake system ZnuABC Zn-binding protein ZnuA